MVDEESTLNKHERFPLWEKILLLGIAAAGITGTFWSMSRQHEIYEKQGEERQAAETERQETERRLNELESAVLKKAEYSDGKPGFSFQDQANLANGLDCGFAPVEGEPIVFCREGDAFQISGRGIGRKYVKIRVTEEKARVYLDKKQ